jgi:hypothetical protein
MKRTLILITVFLIGPAHEMMNHGPCWIRDRRGRHNHANNRDKIKAPFGKAMRLLVQRVSEARVSVDSGITGSIRTGLLVFAGISREDTIADAEGARRKNDRQAAIFSFRRSQKSSNRPLRRQHRRAMMLLAPSSVQCIPERLRRVPMETLHPASRTPDEVQMPCLWNCGYRMRWRLR